MLQETLRKRVLNYLLRNVPCDRATATPLAEEFWAWSDPDGGTSPGEPSIGLSAAAATVRLADASDYANALAADGLLGSLRWRVEVSGRRQTIGIIAEPGGALAITVPRDIDHRVVRPVRCGLVRDRAPHWARRLGVRPTSVSVAEPRLRWGQCTKNGESVLHWAVFQLSPHLVDLAVVPELAHLAEPRHGPAFLRLLDRVLPDHSERSEELAQTGRGVWLDRIVGGEQPGA
jgi:Protein of unknown function DUF45